MNTAKVFKQGNSQAVRLPKEFRFQEGEIFIRKQGDVVLLIPKKAARWQHLKSCIGKFKGNFVSWLFDFAFIECMHLSTLLRFEPKLLAAAIEKAGSTCPNAKARLADWFEQGFEAAKGDGKNRQLFVPFMQDKSNTRGNRSPAVTEAEARKV